MTMSLTFRISPLFQAKQLTNSQILNYMRVRSHFHIDLSKFSRYREEEVVQANPFNKEQHVLSACKNID